MARSCHARGPSVPVVCPHFPVVVVLRRSDDRLNGRAADAPYKAPGCGKGSFAMAVDAGGTVLVVEDDVSMREAIERLLHAAGLGCAVYASADALLAHGVDAGSACVISDLRLPGISGLELIGMLRERKISLPFILITAHDAPGMREEAASCGAAAYLPKPFRGTVLLDAVRAAIESPRPS